MRKSNTSEKEQITVLATVASDGKKLPLLFIAKGQTAYVEGSQLGDVAYHWKSHSESGWINDEIFQEYLMHLKEYFADDEELHLILDIYKSHLTENVKKLAQNLNIILHFIPAGKTDLYQPLDRSVFGPFKAFARRLFRQRNVLGEPIEINKIDACSDIIRAWEAVTMTSIGRGWSIYTEDVDEKDDVEHIERKPKKRPRGRTAKPKVMEE